MKDLVGKLYKILGELLRPGTWDSNQPSGETMEHQITGSIFEDALRKAVLDVPAEKRSELPLGIIMLENDGTLSSLYTPVDDISHEDAASSMVAMEYILYSFGRQDWMAEFILSLDKQKKIADEKRIQDKRSKFTLITGGKKD